MRFMNPTAETRRAWRVEATDVCLESGERLSLNDVVKVKGKVVRVVRQVRNNPDKGTVIYVVSVEAKSDARRRENGGAAYLLNLPREDLNHMHKAAAKQSISTAEWMRQTLRKAL